MTKKNNRNKLYRQMMLAGLVSAFTSHALAQQVTLQNNQLQISGGSGTTFSSQSPTISSLGVVQTIIDVPTTNGVGIPSFSFTMLPNSVPDGVYSYRVGVTFDDAANDRRLEAEIGTLQLTVSGGAIVSGTIPGSQNLRVLGRNGGGTLQVQINVSNSSTNGPITLNGGSVSFNASNLISRIRSSHSQFDSVILAEFDQPATYDYRIAVQQTGTTAAGSPTLAFGTGTTFTAFPQVQAPGCGAANCVGNTTAFLLNTNELASDYTAAYTVTGRFNVTTVSSGGSSGGSTGGTTVTGDVFQDTNNLGSTVDNITVTTGETPSTETITQINDAVSTTNSLLTNTSSQLSSGTVSTAQALETLTTVNKALELAGTATQSGGTVDTTSTTTAITNVANVLGALATKTLSTEQKTEISNIATNTVTSTTKLITSETPRATILALVEATASLLQKSNDATGSLAAALVTQIQALSTSATQKILPTLPESIRGNVDLNSIDAIRALTSAKASVAAVVLKSSPEACDRSAYRTAKEAHTIAYEADRFSQAHLDAHIARRDAKREYNDCLRAVRDRNSSSPIQSAQGQLLAATAAEPSFSQTDNGATLVSYEGQNYIASIGSGRIVPSVLSDGITVLPDGSLLYVTAGTSTELSAAPVNDEALSNAIIAAGYSEITRNNGVINIGLGNNERFAGVLAYENIGSNVAGCSSVSFNAPTGNPASTDYVFTMSCDDGAVQHITPFPDSSVFFDTVTNAGFDVRTDRNTGVISIEGVGNVRPSFFVTPLTDNDTTYLNANKTAEGIAIRSTDANGDGKTDYEVISENGVQLMYGL
ncbi:MAG: hypothetical protein H7A05_02680 [Pseudomonadales bacterium]|nr:hypothetical protein [Pseudomonadales bacterium]